MITVLMLAISARGYESASRSKYHVLRGTDVPCRVSVQAICTPLTGTRTPPHLPLCVGVTRAGPRGNQDHSVVP